MLVLDIVDITQPYTALHSLTQPKPAHTRITPQICRPITHPQVIATLNTTYEPTTDAPPAVLVTGHLRLLLLGLLDGVGGVLPHHEGEERVLAHVFYRTVVIVPVRMEENGGGTSFIGLWCCMNLGLYPMREYKVSGMLGWSMHKCVYMQCFK